MTMKVPVIIQEDHHHTKNAGLVQAQTKNSKNERDLYQTKVLNQQK